jgi:hypothetical protein
MDTEEKEQLAQQQLDELKAALKTRPVTNTGAVGSSYGTDTITLNGGIYPNTVVGGGYTITSGITANTGPYTVNTSSPGFTFSNITATANPWATTTTAGRMELTGDNADLVINGVSILDILRDRLNVMIPNPALEKEWDQLKVLGDQYRELEAKLKEQGEMWAKLKETPPSEL